MTQENKMKKLVLAIVLSLASICFGQDINASQHGKVEVETNKTKINLVKKDPPTKEVLIGTYLVTTGTNMSSVPAQVLTPIDEPSTINCPASTCTILANQFVETQGTIPSNNFGICLFIDNEEIPNGCWYNNDTPSDGTFVQGVNSSWEVDLPTGDHTVQTFIYSYYGCEVAHYAIQYLVYKP